MAVLSARISPSIRLRDGDFARPADQPVDDVAPATRLRLQFALGKRYHLRSGRALGHWLEVALTSR
jgi:hypothetical protein